MKLLILATVLSLFALTTLAQDPKCNATNDVNATNICTGNLCNKHESCVTKNCYRINVTAIGSCQDKLVDNAGCFENVNCKGGNCDKSTTYGEYKAGLCKPKASGSALTIIIIIVIIAGLGVGGYIFWKKRQEKLGSQLGREPMMH